MEEDEALRLCSCSCCDVDGVDEANSLPAWQRATKLDDEMSGRACSTGRGTALSVTGDCELRVPLPLPLLPCESM